jgi:hypothetical protein
MQLITYNVKLPNYLERFETHHHRLRKCKISTKHTIKDMFIKHSTYLTVLPFVFKTLMMLERRTI